MENNNKRIDLNLLVQQQVEALNKLNQNGCAEWVKEEMEKGTPLSSIYRHLQKREVLVKKLKISQGLILDNE